MTQSIHIIYDTSDTESTVYCPFTGDSLLKENLKFPASVIMVLHEMEPSEPIFISEDWRAPFDELMDRDEDVFSDSEKIEAWLKEVDDDSDHLIIRFERYGDMPGDHAHMVFVLRNPY
jgi:hypothetical protein